MNARSFSFALLPIFAATATAQTFFGLSQLSAGGAVTIAEINALTGATTAFANVGNVAGNVNGLANVDNDTFYFTSGSANRTFFRFTASTNSLTNLGTLPTENANGTWQNGKYIYATHDGTGIYEVTPGVSSITSVLIGNLPSARNYGDVVVHNGGLFGSALGGTFRSNLNGSGFTALSSSAPQAQLGFASNGLLYAVGTNDRVYSVNTTTGVMTQTGTLSNASAWFIRDAASNAVPEPASMAVLGLGLAALKRRRAAKKS